MLSGNFTDTQWRLVLTHDEANIGKGDVIAADVFTVATATN